MTPEQQAPVQTTLATEAPGADAAAMVCARPLDPDQHGPRSMVGVAARIPAG